MYPIYGTVAALAIVAIYYIWRSYFLFTICRERSLRRRVAYMLWVMAYDKSSGSSEEDGLSDDLLQDVTVSG
jgi:hypothetical protein